ncbi:hypothetical protein F5I97DRAFT_1939515 [Phlebopus sp. FC_14]|nr:hypothetical protein F5I97DRAFT_1939515 [Phlebopus sp. FC_14]
MRLISTRTLVLHRGFPGEPPDYAILSHRWEAEEILFQDFTAVTTSRTIKGARRDGYDYVWIGTCCINKSSRAEPSEAINSMYRWYKNSGLCYVYLYDFEHGWTLQESITPPYVPFYSFKWQLIGNKTSLGNALNDITGARLHIIPGTLYTATQHRTDQDRAYSLMGLFGVFMPALYGEGANAFCRLQLEIIHTSHDQKCVEAVISDEERYRGM